MQGCDINTRAQVNQTSLNLCAVGIAGRILHSGNTDIVARQGQASSAKFRLSSRDLSTERDAQNDVFFSEAFRISLPGPSAVSTNTSHHTGRKQDEKVLTRIRDFNCFIRL